MKEIAFFITPHGYGHATRATAVIEALSRLHRRIHFHLLTTVPQSLFSESIDNFTCHRVAVDVGLVQNSALGMDIPGTIEALDDFLPYREELLEDLSQRCRRCALIVCDIAPIGIAVARRLGIPAVLIENFTWDWIYAPYCGLNRALNPHVRYLRNLFHQADYRIQTDPLCFPAPCDLHCGPIFRQSRGESAAIRSSLQPGDRKPMVFVTMGGVAQDLPNLKEIQGHTGYIFVFSGQKQNGRLGDNIILLDRHCRLYHPDLIEAADIVVCKAGYSTIAECYQAGARVISVGRDDFAETAPLEQFLRQHLDVVTITPAAYNSGEWLVFLPGLLARPDRARATVNGATAAAAFIYRLAGQQET